MKTHENLKKGALAGFFVVAAFASDACRRSGSFILSLSARSFRNVIAKISQIHADMQRSIRYSPAPKIELFARWTPAPCASQNARHIANRL